MSKTIVVDGKTYVPCSGCGLNVLVTNPKCLRCGTPVPALAAVEPEPVIESFGRKGKG